MTTPDRSRSLPLAITGKQPSISTLPATNPVDSPSIHAAHSSPAADPVNFPTDHPAHSSSAADPVKPPTCHAAHSSPAADPVNSPTCHVAYSSSADNPVESSSCPAAHSSPAAHSNPAADPVDSISSVPGPLRDKYGRFIIDISEKGQFLCFSSTIFIIKRCFGELLHKTRKLEFYLTFQDMPEEVKDLWWEEFKTLFAWPGYPDEIVKDVFYRASGLEYRKNMENIQKLVWQAGKPKPDFLTNEAWAQWIVFWEYLRSSEISELGRRKRGSSRDLAINRPKHRRMEKYEVLAQKEAVSEGMIELRSSNDRVPFHSNTWKVALSEGNQPKADILLGFGGNDAALLNMASNLTSGYSHMDQEAQDRVKDAVIERLTQRVDAHEEQLQQLGRRLELQQEVMQVQRELIQEYMKMTHKDEMQYRQDTRQMRKDMHQSMMWTQQMMQQQMQMLFALQQQVQQLVQVQLQQQQATGVDAATNANGLCSAAAAVATEAAAATTMWQ